MNSSRKSLLIELIWNLICIIWKQRILISRIECKKHTISNLIKWRIQIQKILMMICMSLSKLHKTALIFHNRVSIWVEPKVWIQGMPKTLVDKVNQILTLAYKCNSNSFIIKACENLAHPRICNSKSKGANFCPHLSNLILWIKQAQPRTYKNYKTCKPTSTSSNQWPASTNNNYNTSYCSTKWYYKTVHNSS